MEPEPKVLIVDDDEFIQTCLEAVLSTEGLQLVQAHNGEEALALFDAQEFDVVLLDIMMPGLNGLDVCALLQKRKKAVPVPVILMSAAGEEDVVVSGLNLGAVDFVRKPFRAFELRARVKTALRLRNAFKKQHEDALKKQSLIGMIVHDIRGPLTVFQSYSAMVTEGYLGPDEILNFSKTVEQESKRLFHMVDDLLMLAKSDRSEIELVKEPLDLVATVNRITKAYKFFALNAKVKLDLVCEPVSAIVPVDRLIIERCLENLLLNAIKHTRRPGLVTVALERGEGEVAIHISDNGYGVPAEFRDKIFELYETANARAKGIPGHGVGLAFCKMAVDKHGGSIKVGDRVGGGAVFTLRLPVA
jgi:two-component system sensor histidine kinase/response regulator